MNRENFDEWLVREWREARRWDSTLEWDHLWWQLLGAARMASMMDQLGEHRSQLLVCLQLASAHAAECSGREAA